MSLVQSAAGQISPEFSIERWTHLTPDTRIVLALSTGAFIPIFVLPSHEAIARLIVRVHALYRQERWFLSLNNNTESLRAWTSDEVVKRLGARPSETDRTLNRYRMVMSHPTAALMRRRILEPSRRTRCEHLVMNATTNVTPNRESDTDRRQKYYLRKK